MTFLSSSRERELCVLAIALLSGELSPMNKSPSAYSPGPVLKKRCICLARIGLAIACACVRMVSRIIIAKC